MPLVEKYWGAWKHGSYTVDIPPEPEPRGPVTRTSSGPVPPCPG